MNEAAFLKSILEQPADDVVRLAYADWLMERDDPASTARGEFIQVQIALARRCEAAGAAGLRDLARVPELLKRNQELLAEHGETWAEPIKKLVDAYEFRRGFVESIETSCVSLAKQAKKLFGLTPVRRIKFRDPLTTGVAELAYLARVEEMDFSKTYMGDPGLRRLLTSPNVAALRWVDLSYCYITNFGLSDLARSPVLAQLTHLDLGYNALTTVGVRNLLASPHYNRLLSLGLKGNPQIDVNQQQFLDQMRAGAPEPRLLQMLLRMQGRQALEYTNAHVRELAARAGDSPDAAAVLAEGLSDGRIKVRCAAAGLLAQLGPAGVAGVPMLVQRLFEHNDKVRNQVAPALARLVSELPEDLQRWLCVLANPLLPAQVNLRAALDAGLPEDARAGFATVCARRAAWWKHVAAGNKGPAPAVEGEPASDAASLREAVQKLLVTAGKHAGRHHRGNQKKADDEAGRNKEAAWLLARLAELLQKGG